MDIVLDHIALNVSDEKKMLAFYTEVLGLAPERLPEFLAGEVSFPSVRVNPETIIDIFPKNLWHKTGDEPGDRPANLNHFCLAAGRAEWEAIRQRLAEKEIPVEDGPGPRWGARGTGTALYFRDPEQNLVEIRCYETT